MSRFVDAGGRRTASRQAIVETIAGARGHLTAEEIAERVHRRFPSVNLSTVYRTLDTLEDLAVDESHQHLYCEKCERVEELPVPKLGAFLRLLDREYGFEVDRRHFAIVGRCRRCRASAAKDGG